MRLGWRLGCGLQSGCSRCEIGSCFGGLCWFALLISVSVSVPLLFLGPRVRCVSWLPVWCSAVGGSIWKRTSCRWIVAQEVAASVLPVLPFGIAQAPLGCFVPGLLLSPRVVVAVLAREPPA